MQTWKRGVCFSLQINTTFSLQEWIYSQSYLICLMLKRQIREVLLSWVDYIILEKIMELRTSLPTSHLEIRIADLLKKSRQSTMTAEKLMIFLRMHYLYEPDQNAVLSKSLAILARQGDGASMCRLLTALQTLKMPLGVLSNQLIHLKDQTDYLMGHLLRGYHQNRVTNQLAFRTAVQTIIDIWQNSVHDQIRPAVESTLLKAWPTQRQLSDNKRYPIEQDEMAWVIGQISRLEVPVHDTQLQKKITKDLILCLKKQNHARMKSLLAIKTDHLSEVALAALRALSNELQPKAAVEINYHYFVQEILTATTLAERQSPPWQIVKTVIQDTLWLAIKKPHFPSFYVLRHFLSPSLLIKALSLQLRQVDQPQAVIHLIIGTCLETATEKGLPNHNQIGVLAQKILHKALQVRNRQAIASLIKLKPCIAPEYLAHAQKDLEKAVHQTFDPIHLLITDLSPIKEDQKCTPPQVYFKAIEQRETAIICQLYRWARQGNWSSYLECRTYIFDFNEQKKHQVNIIKPQYLQDTILTVLIKGYFSDTLKDRWLEEISHFIAADALGYLVDDEPIPGNPFSAALPYVLQHSTDEEGDRALITLLTKHVFHPGQAIDHQTFWHLAIKNKFLGRSTLEIMYQNEALRAQITESRRALDGKGDVLYEAILQLDKEKISFFITPPLAMSLSQSHIKLLQSMHEKTQDYSSEGIRFSSILELLKPIFSLKDGKSLTNKRLKTTLGVNTLNTLTAPTYFALDSGQEIDNKPTVCLEKLTSRYQFIHPKWDQILYQKKEVILHAVLTALCAQLEKNPEEMDGMHLSLAPIFLHYPAEERRQIFQLLSESCQPVLLSGKQTSSSLSEQELQLIKKNWCQLTVGKLISLMSQRFCRDYLRDFPDYLIVRHSLLNMFSDTSRDFFDYASQRIYALIAGAHTDVLLTKHVSVAKFLAKLTEKISIESIRSALTIPITLVHSTEEPLEEIALNALCQLIPQHDWLYRIFYNCLNKETLLADFQQKYHYIFHYHSGKELSIGHTIADSKIKTHGRELNAMFCHTTSRHSYRDVDEKKLIKGSSTPILKSVTQPEDVSSMGLTIIADKKTTPPMNLQSKRQLLFTSYFSGGMDHSLDQIQKIIESPRKNFFIADFCSELQCRILQPMLKKQERLSLKRLTAYVQPFFSSPYLRQATLASFSSHFKSIFWQYPQDSFHLMGRFLSEQLAYSLTDHLGFAKDSSSSNPLWAVWHRYHPLDKESGAGRFDKICRMLNQILYDPLLEFIQQQHKQVKVPDPSQEGHFILALTRYMQRLPCEKLAESLNETLSSTRVWRAARWVGYQSEEKCPAFTIGMGPQEWSRRCQYMQRHFHRAEQLACLQKLVTAAWEKISEQIKHKLLQANNHLGLDKLTGEGFSGILALQFFNFWQMASLSTLADSLDIEESMSSLLDQTKLQQPLQDEPTSELLKAIWEKMLASREWLTLLPQAPYRRIGVATISSWLKGLLMGNKQQPAQINAAKLAHYLSSKPDVSFTLEVARACQFSKLPAELEVIIAECLLKVITQTNQVTGDVSSRTISLNF